MPGLEVLRRILNFESSARINVAISSRLSLVFISHYRLIKYVYVQILDQNGSAESRYHKAASLGATSRRFELPR